MTVFLIYVLVAAFFGFLALIKWFEYQTNKNGLMSVLYWPTKYIIDALHAMFGIDDAISDRMPRYGIFKETYLVRQWRWYSYVFIHAIAWPIFLARWIFAFILIAMIVTISFICCAGAFFTEEK